MKVQTRSIDHNTGEVSIEEWELWAFGPERLAMAWKAKHDKLQGPNVMHMVKVTVWDNILAGGHSAAFVLKEYVNGRLETVAIGLAEVIG